ncbi:hypothetical protein HMPREF0819_0104, partial [Streptococcus equinus ATCC 9812]
LGTASNTLLISAIGFAFITIYAIAHYVRVHKLHVSNVKEEKI